MSTPTGQTASEAKVKCRLVNKAMKARVTTMVIHLGLDRRKSYCVGYSGELSTEAKCTTACSGCSCDCSEGRSCSHGAAGCDECGYTGKRVVFFPEPVTIEGRTIQVKPAARATKGGQSK